MPTEGQQVGPYELIRKLGEGAFGEVWLARHRYLGVERAMKIPTDPAYVRQLRLEGRLQFELDHPNIVRTFDINPDHNPPYLMMEYVRGESLRDRLRREGKLAPDEAVRILCQVLEALAAAHDAGGLHRDLKPGNILLTGDGTVKVTDFGLGVVQAEMTRSLLLSDSMMSASGRSVSGTHDYMSPQQRRGEEPAPHDDLYAVGTMACELLTGERPAPGIPVEELLEEVGVDLAFCPLIQKALTRPKRRYRSATDMLKAFRGVPEGHLAPPPRLAVSGEPRPTPTPPPRPMRRVPAPAHPTPRPPAKPRLQVYRGWPFDEAEAKRRQQETARALGVPVAQTTFPVSRCLLTMVLIPAGEFVIGSPPDEAERNDDEKQKQTAIERPFWMGKYPVTQGLWEAVTGSNPSRFKGARNPVDNVSWDDAQEFLQKLNARVRGSDFLLPTEAQWEHACRTGTATPFHFGKTISTDQANYDGNYTYGRGRKGVNRERTTRVGSFAPNAWGLCDMHGNVWEWCASPYSKDFNGSERKGADAPCGLRVFRGGSWCSSPVGCRSSYRYRDYPRYASVGNGFRLSRGL